MRSVRQLNVRVDLGAELLRAAQRLLKGREHARFDRRALDLRGDAQAHALEPLACGQIQRLGELERRRVQRVLSDHVREQQRGVGDVPRERPRLVERGCERDHPVARDGAVSRLQPNHAAKRSRLADRAARVGSDRPRCEPRGHGGGAAPGGPAGNTLAVPRVEHRTKRRMLVRRAHRELVLVGLREQARARVGEARHRGRGVWRAVALEDARAGLARQPLRAEKILSRERHARERRACRRRRWLGVREPREAVQRRTVGPAVRLRSAPVLGEELRGVELARSHGGRGLRR